MRTDLIKWYVVAGIIAKKVKCSTLYAWLVIKGRRPATSHKAKKIMLEYGRQQRKLAAMSEE
jgi:hypothetical protein